MKCNTCRYSDYDNAKACTLSAIVDSEGCKYERDPYLCECGTEMEHKVVVTAEEGGFKQYVHELFCPKREGGEPNVRP